MINPELKKIIDFLFLHKGIDFSGYRLAMLERRTQKRLFKTKCSNYSEYLEYLKQHVSELDQLLHVYTINVSSFCRNSLSFGILRNEVFPSILEQKKEEKNKNIRIWSSACARGEEPYSIAIILNEIFERTKVDYPFYIIGTDIDKLALDNAENAIYSAESIENVKHGMVKRYFTESNRQFRLNTNIKEMVQFSYYNLLNEKQKVPPESIYGDFDIVFCRNVLIYLDEQQQKIVFDKLYHSLKPNGYLVLGEAEVPIVEFKHKFRRLGRHCKIYRKVTFL